MKIRDFISIVDNAQQISELDLKGGGNAQNSPTIRQRGPGGVFKTVPNPNYVPPANQAGVAPSAAPPAQGNMDIKYQGKPVSNAPANLAPTAATATATPNSNVIRYPTMNISPSSKNATAEPGKLSKAWDITKKGASALGQATKKGASALGQAAKTYGPGLARGAANLATGAVQAAGNIAAQTAGGIAQTVGAIPGGAVAGYKTARAGKQFKMRPDAADEPAAASAPSAGSAPSAAAGSAPSAAGGSGGYDEVADLRQLVNRLDARVTALSARIPAQSAPAQAVGEHRRPRRLRVVR